jgi:hypothetical protein
MTMKKSPLNARRAACWEKTRAKGMAHFIIVRGILGWGLPTGLLVPLIHHLFFHSYYSMREATVSIIVYALAGISFGYWNSAPSPDFQPRTLGENRLVLIESQELFRV